MKQFRPLVVNSVFFLNVLLLFLVAFRGKLDVPDWLHAVGRMHPLLLHLPIGLLILAALLVVFKSGFKKKSFQKFLDFVLYFAALTAAVTAIMGTLLSTEEGYDAVQLNRHLITGTLVSLLAWLLLWLGRYGDEVRKIFSISLGVTTVMVTIAGHLGSVLTHGENFILQPLGSATLEAKVITDSTSLYEASIEPIFRAKCMSCHNEKKAKGKLILSSVEQLMKGGKHGAIFTARDPEKSNLIKRLNLPEDQDDHMPPSGKPQLSKNELRLVYLWIEQGADLMKAWTKFSPQDSLRLLADASIHQQRQATSAHYTFPFANQETIVELNSPSCTVTQYALSEPAISVDFYLAQSFTPAKLEALLKIKEQLVNLNLSRMPVTDGEGALIGQFKNLEKLNLNQTSVTGAVLSSLKGMINLQSISLTGTNVDKSSLQAIGSLPALTQVFLWNTKVVPDDATELKKEFPKISWDMGFEPHEILKLTPPILTTETTILGEDEPIVLKHNLPGTLIRYTLDGTMPDSVKGTLYKDKIYINKFTALKTAAYKDGWYGSPVSEYHFFSKGVTPLSAQLKFPPNKDYKGQGSLTLINNKKGAADNFKDIAWLAFREQPLECLFELKPSAVTTMTLSYAENFSSYILPPASLEVYAGNEPNQLKLVEKMTPQQPKESGPTLVKAIELKIPPSYRFYKLIARPVAVVPAWITKKKEKGWLFVDEVIFK